MKKLLLLHLLLAMFFGAQTVKASVVLNATNFPDANFRAYISLKTGVAVGRTISDATLASITEIFANEKGISSLQGIEYFTKLTNLQCYTNQLTSLDVSKNTELTALYCFNNQLTSLDVSKNTKLITLYCSSNQLTSLDVSKNTQLTHLHCNNNQLTSLDVSKNTELTELECSNNQLTLLNVSNNTKLTKLYCIYNQLTSLDVSKNTKLIELDCQNNQLTSLDVSKNIELTEFDCISNQLTSLDVSKNTELTELYCSNNNLTSLNLTKNTELTELGCDDNQLTSLDVTKNTKLTKLHCVGNQLTSLDVSKNTELSSLNCTWNQLFSLDVSKNTLLKELRCHGNKISYLSLSKNTELEGLNCSSNKIDQLNLSNNTKLTALYCNDNRLTHLELDNTSLTDRTAVDVGNQSSTRRFTVNSYGSSNNNCWTLFVNTTDASRIRALKIDGVSQTPKVTASGWLVVSEDLKKIPQKVEYEYDTGKDAARWMPVTVNYDVKKYGVYIDGTELTSLNFYDIPGLKEGTAYFYDESYDLGWSGIYPTLVLYDAKIEGEKGLYNKECYDLNIIARGNNSITATDWTGFDTDPVVKTTISGGGKLWITATGDRNGGIYNSDASTLKITDGTTVICQGDGYGFFDDGGTLYIQDNSILACYGNESASVELPVESKCKFDSNIGIRYPVGAYIGNSYHVFYEGTTTDVQRDWVVIGPDNQATQNLITDLTTNAQQHDYVDLGLPSGTLWATCNIGATTPEEYGSYFAWAETDSKSNYSWSTYKYCAGTNDSMTKYCTAEYYGTFDGLDALEDKDDAATAKWGSSWRMPSMEQFDELMNSEYTTVKKSFQNDTYGMLITSKLNGNSIFLPAAGILMDTDLINDGSRAFYWSRDVARPSNFLARDFSFTTTSNTPNDTQNRCYGLSIRPVRNPEKEHEYVDLGLPSGTLWATCNVGANSPEEYGDYFAWGETEPKSNYSWSTYKWCKGSENTFTKYCLHSDYGYNGYFDELEELLPEDDAATVNWGGEWQTPEYKQYQELFNTDYTTREWTAKTGKDGSENYGMLITSKINGNSIFLPAGGMYNEGSSLEDVNNLGFYYSRFIHFPYNGEHTLAFTRFTNGGSPLVFTYRYQGLCVRPVRAKREVYTDFVAETGTLTYYYDSQMPSRSGVTELYDPVNNPSAVRFTDYYKKVTKAVIHPSMKFAPLTSTRDMFYAGTNPETYVMQNLPNMESIEGLENLNTENVTDMCNMFLLCRSLKTLDLSTFNTGKVTKMVAMFQGCENLKMVDVSSFDISRVTDMGQMFLGCNRLTTICCANDWSRTTAASDLMFSGCTSLIGGNGTGYNSNFLDNTYARPDGGTSSPGYFTADTMTGISLTEEGRSQMEDGAIYNLAGQKMVNGQWSNGKLPLGIYIVGGRKVVIK